MLKSLSEEGSEQVTVSTHCLTRSSSSRSGLPAATLFSLGQAGGKVYARFPVGSCLVCDPRSQSSCDRFRLRSSLWFASDSCGGCDALAASGLGGDVGRC